MLFRKRKVRNSNPLLDFLSLSLLYINNLGTPVTLDLVSSVVVVSLHGLNQLVQGGAVIGLDLERIWINS